MTAPEQTADPVDLACCPTCNTPTTPYRGHQTLCFACTLAELGETWEALKARTRVTEKRAAKRMSGGRVDQVNLG